MIPIIISMIPPILAALRPPGGNKLCTAYSITPITRIIIPSINMIIFYSNNIKEYNFLNDHILYISFCKPNFMVSKRPKVIKTNQNQAMPSVSSAGGGSLATSTPQTGSPTTADSGLVSPKITPKGSQTPRQKANVTSGSSETGLPVKREANRAKIKIPSKVAQVKELRISEKRNMVTTLSRQFLKNEPMLTKMLRYFVNNNMLVDPVKQELRTNTNLDSSNGNLGAQIKFNLVPNQATSLNHAKVHRDLNELDKDLKVSLVCNLDIDNFVEAVTIYKPTKTPRSKKG